MEESKGFVFFKSFYQELSEFFYKNSFEKNTFDNDMNPLIRQTTYKKAPIFNEIKTPSTEESFSLAEIFKRAVLNYLLKEEGFEKAFYPFFNGEKIVEKWVFEIEGNLHFSIDFVKSVYFLLYSHIYNLEIMNKEIPNNLNFWEELFLYIHFKSQNFLKKITLPRRFKLYPFFSMTKLPYSEDNIDFAINERDFKILFLLRKRFYSIFEHRIRYLGKNKFMNKDDHLLIFDTLSNYSAFLNYLFNYLDERGKYECMLFLLYFYYYYDFETVFYYVRDHLVNYRTKERFYKLTYSLFKPLYFLLELKIDPIMDEFKVRKKYLFSYLNPIRLELERRFRIVRDSVSL